MAPHFDDMGQRVHGRKILLAILLSGIAVASTGASAQEPMLARLNHATTNDVLHPGIAGSVSTWSLPPGSHPASPGPLQDSALSRAAAQALFGHSDLDRALALAAQALRHNPNDAEALFVRMEVAGMKDDASMVLDAAVRLCQAGKDSPNDVRLRLAAMRIRENAANTPEFHATIPQIESLLTNSRESWPELRAALLQAAMDGAPGLDPYALSRAAGILTDWRIVGPLGKQSLLTVDEAVSHSDGLTRPSYENRAVENFQFPDGRIELPSYLPHHGTFYAASQFASLTAAQWQMDVEAAGPLAVYVDGQRVLGMANTGGNRSRNFEASPGPHRVLVKFMGAATPLRVAITPARPQGRAALGPHMSLSEMTYLLAADDFASGQFDTATSQIAAVPSAESSAALQYLLAQSITRSTQAPAASLAAWSRLRSLAPSALAADQALAAIAASGGDSQKALLLAGQVLAKDPNDARALAIATAAWKAHYEPAAAGLWSRRVAEHPSCKTLQDALAFYRAQRQLAEAASAQQKLDGCAPESLDYAKSLSQQGSHAEAAKALERLLAAAPLNRDARLMLVRELQLSGQDKAAQHAAAAWLYVAPNAENYHRLAAAADSDDAPLMREKGSDAFYLRYRRDAATIARETAGEPISGTSVLLLDDHVAIARQDGSVALYVHTLKRFVTSEAAGSDGDAGFPPGAQVLAFRILHPDGTATPIDRAPNASLGSLAAGDVLDEEYVLYYAGDGGIPEHTEVFQFVFGSFDQQVLRSRFVVLTPAERADRGVVIATGGVPEMSEKVRGNTLERVWDKEKSGADVVSAKQPGGGRPIVRVVEEENGWSQPSNAEHRRRIETIHPGPQPRDS